MDFNQHKAIERAASKLPVFVRTPYQRVWWNNRVLDNNSAARLAEWCEVSVRTASRWKNTGAIPKAMQKLAELYMDGRVRPNTRHWKNWAFSLWKGEHIITNGRFHLSDCELETYFLVFDDKRRLERQLKEANAKIRHLEKATAQMQLFEEDGPAVALPVCQCCYCKSQNNMHY